MSSFKLFRNTHRWTGIVLATVLAMTSVTGFMLLIKKRIAWIQPPTQTDVAGDANDFISTQRLLEIVLSQGHADFTSVGDIDRVDLRPGDRIFKVRSKHHYAEMQVGAVSGEVLSVAWRPSDLLETIHDGSWFAGWIHDWLMPLVPIALLVMIASGLWLWIRPMLWRRRRRRATRHPPAST
jgi:uncharacterized iron-regulated membrane protein